MNTKSRLITEAHQLKFAATPTSVHETRVPFDERHESTARYLQILRWLKSAKQELEQPAPFDDRNFSRRREVLYNNVNVEIHRLEAMAELAWSRSKVERELFSGPGLKQSGVPVIEASTSLTCFLNLIVFNLALRN